MQVTRRHFGKRLHPRTLHRISRVVYKKSYVDPDTQIETYDARVEREAAERPSVPTRSRISLSEVQTAFEHADIVCNGPKVIADARCAVFWDIADEMWSAYIRQVDFDVEMEKEKLQGEPWSLKRRMYDL